MTGTHHKTNRLFFLAVPTLASLCPRPTSVGTLVEKHRFLRLRSLDLPTSHSKMTLFVDLMCENLLKKNAL